MKSNLDRRWPSWDMSPLLQSLVLFLLSHTTKISFDGSCHLPALMITLENCRAIEDIPQLMPTLEHLIVINDKLKGASTQKMQTCLSHSTGRRW